LKEWPQLRRTEYFSSGSFVIKHNGDLLSDSGSGSVEIHLMKSAKNASFAPSNVVVIVYILN
jgi:hypothetical protein